MSTNRASHTPVDRGGDDAGPTERQSEAPIYEAFARFVGDADERASDFRMFATGYHAADEARATLSRKVDSQVRAAARHLDATQAAQPEWLWFIYDGVEGVSETRYSFGRWPKGAPGMAPYVRADIALAAAPSPDEDGDGGEQQGCSDLLDALQRVAKAAKAMPRETPAPGGAGTMHNFSIEAGVVWDLDRALDHLAVIQAGYSMGKYRSGKLVPSTGIEEKGGQQGATLAGQATQQSPRPTVSALTGECPSRGQAAITEDEIVKLIAKTWLTAKGTDDTTADEFSDPTELALISPEDHAACAEIAQTLLHRLSAFAAAIPSARWQPITTAPLTTDPILVTGWVFADDDWNSGYVGYWRDAPAHKAKERYQCIGYMVQPPSGHRCVGHRNGPVNVTHWMPLPPAPCDGSGEADETEGLSPQGDSAVTEGQAPKSSSTPPPTPEAQTPSDDRMTVEEAREVLNSFDRGAWPAAADYVSYLRKIANDVPHRPQYALSCRTFSNRIETALRTLSDQATGEVRT